MNKYQNLLKELDSVYKIEALKYEQNQKQKEYIIKKQENNKKRINFIESKLKEIAKRLYILENYEELIKNKKKDWLKSNILFILFVIFGYLSISYLAPFWMFILIFIISFPFISFNLFNEYLEDTKFIRVTKSIFTKEVLIKDQDVLSAKLTELNNLYIRNEICLEDLNKFIQKTENDLEEIKKYIDTIMKKVQERLNLSLIQGKIDMDDQTKEKNLEGILTRIRQMKEGI